MSSDTEGKLRDLALLTPRALLQTMRGDIAGASQTYAQVAEVLETVRSENRSAAALDLFDSRNNARFEAAIRFFLETGQPGPALNLIDRTRFRSGCDLIDGYQRFGSPLDPSDTPPIIARQGELILVEWLYPTHEWSLSIQAGRDSVDLRRIPASSIDTAEPAAKPRNDLWWFSDFDRARARAQSVIDAFANELAGTYRITIVPHGHQWRVPWAALAHPVTGRPLFETHDISVLPSLRYDSLTISLPRASDATECLVIGDPTQDLENARSEAKQVAELLGADPIMGPLATLQKVKDALRDRTFRVIHYAGHGVYTTEGLTGLRLADGVLDAEDLAESQVQADLVYLASCWGGMTEFSVWNELRGLIRGLLVGGTRHIVSSTYPLGDRAGGLISRSFYDHLLEPPGRCAPSVDATHPAAALRSALAGLPEDVPAKTWGSLYVTGRR